MNQSHSAHKNAHLSNAEYLRDILRAPIYEIAIITPLQNMPRISERLKNTIQLKREDRQPVHSFKLRGAYNMMVQLNEREKNAGVIAASAGNHAQGVALSGNKLGIKTTIVMPRTTPEIKIAAVKSFGGSVILHGNNFDEAKTKALALADEHGYTLIPPFDHPSIIAGQGTIGIELIQQNAHLDYIFLPVGGGGMAAGISLIIKQLMPHIQLIAVEAEESACLKAAIEADEPVTLKNVGTFADGVAVKRIGDESFRLCKEHLDGIITVTSDEICAAVKDIFEDTRAISEPAGALSLAGLKRYSEENQLKNKKMAAILSGANTNFHTLRYVSERAELGEKREGLLAVTIPERSGAFLHFCHVLGGRAVTEFNYRYNNETQAKIFVGVRLLHGQEELDIIISDLRNANYEVIDLSEDEMAKVHVRYMIGGRPRLAIRERLYSFEFPEYPGALIRFLSTLGPRWNISLFNYRNQGGDFGRVLCGFELKRKDVPSFNTHLHEIGYCWKEESNNSAYQFFLTNPM